MNIDTQILSENIPMMAKVKHPLRHSINGDTHTIEELKKIVDMVEISNSLKAFIQEELDTMESNAASIHLHVVDHPGNGMSVQLHISPVHLGPRKRHSVMA
jgi:uncharacterized membrane protein affecting hemolysin expression